MPSRIHRAVLETVQDAVVVLDVDHRVMDANPPARELLGLPSGPLPTGVDLRSGLRRQAIAAVDAAPWPTELVLRTGRAQRRHVVHVQPADRNEVLSLEVNASPLLEARTERITGVVASLRDVTAQRRTEAQLSQLTFSDALTGLPNRRLLIDRLEHALARAARHGTHVGVLFVDIDRFKSINETIGHERGDALLQAVAGRLRDALRPTDTAARLNSDEFVVVCEDLAQVDDARKVAERVARSLEEAYEVGDEVVTLTTSVGIALGGPTSTSEELLRNADRAMYQAKESGRSQYQLFNDAIAARAIARLETERDLRRALDGDQLRMHYQPVVDLRTGAVSGVEALLRWMHPERGLVPPNAFIDIAEESGAIIPIGRWALAEACREAVAGVGFGADIDLSVNVSARQAARADFVEAVASALEESGLPPERLTLELTETVFLEAAETTIRSLTCIKDLGVRLAIDDFGTGYSSLTYLRRFPVDIVKVDQSFVGGLNVALEDEAIVEAVISLATTFSLDVIAEGVEHPDHVTSLRRLGCHYGQGYFLGRPAPAGSPDRAA